MACSANLSSRTTGGARCTGYGHRSFFLQGTILTDELKQLFDDINRDGRHSGEDVLRRIVVGLPQHLTLGGITQIITELGERKDEPLSDRLRVWLDGAPMDILILRLREHSSTSFAISHADGDDDYTAFLNSVHDWSNNLRKQGYTKIISVILSFQWSDPTLGPP